MPDLLRQNSEMRADNVYNWTLPAFVARLPDGRNINVCPSAGACTKFCYATNGTYRFPEVVAAHQRNLLAAHDDGPAWRSAMLAELARPKFRPTGRPRLPGLSVNHRVGIPMNRIPQFVKRAAGRSFGEIEAGLTRHGR